MSIALGSSAESKDHQVKQELIALPYKGLYYFVLFQVTKPLTHVIGDPKLLYVPPDRMQYPEHCFV